MEQLLYFIMFVVYVGYSIYQSFQKESGDKKIVQDWENQPLEGEKSIEEMLAEYLDPKKEAVAQVPKKEPVALPVNSDEDAGSEGGKSLVQRMREIPQANNRRERERRKLEVDGDDTLHQQDNEDEEEEMILSPREEFRQRQEEERQAEAAKNTMSPREEYEMLAAERRKERESLHTPVERRKVNIRDQKQLDDINEIYSRKRTKKKSSFKFNARDAIVYQIIMKRKYGR